MFCLIVIFVVAVSVLCGYFLALIESVSIHVCMKVVITVRYRKVQPV